MFIEYCFFLFTLHTCKFYKIASINFVMVVYTKKKKILKSTVWNGDITDKINRNFFEWGRVVLLLLLQELSA